MTIPKLTIIIEDKEDFWIVYAINSTKRFKADTEHEALGECIHELINDEYKKSGIPTVTIERILYSTDICGKVKKIYEEDGYIYVDCGEDIGTLAIECCIGFTPVAGDNVKMYCNIEGWVLLKC